MNNWYHAPPPGSRSGVADYAESLRRSLEPLGSPGVDLYHIGNNGLHAEIYRQALERSGVVVLHDAVLHHFLLGALSCEQYVEEFVYNYGEWRRPMAIELREQRGASAIDPRYFEFPMLRRIAESARSVIVHNPGAAAMARSHGAEDVHIIPHFFETPPPVDYLEIDQFRRSIDVAPGVFLFGIFGYLRETKRILPAIAAFRRLHCFAPDTALLVAGEPVSPDMKRLLETEAGYPGIRRLNHLSDREFEVAAAAVDCCVNLRYPGAGETSGVAIRLMGTGKPVIVTANEENSGFPAAGCLRVQPGIAESAELFDHMSMVWGFRHMARDIGSIAQRHIAEHHNLARVAGEYWRVLCSAAE